MKEFGITIGYTNPRSNVYASDTIYVNAASFAQACGMGIGMIDEKHALENNMRIVEVSEVCPHHEEG